jgi:hypothetical protein
LIGSSQGGSSKPVRINEPPCGISNHGFQFHQCDAMKRHTLFVLCAALGVLCLAGCGGGNTIWVTGVLQKGGEPYKPPEGRKLALYFYPMKDGTSVDPSGDLEMADYNSKDGSFTVPGREGYGIRPGKYRIAVVESLRRETRDQLKKSARPKPGEKRVDNDTNLLDSTFGEKTSPFIRDITKSTKLTLDMASPTE